jgi:hypothetical protein
MDYDKASVEKMLVGECNLQIANGYSLWQEENRANQLSECIINVINNANDAGIGCCGILRLVVVPDNFSNEVMKWSTQLGESWRESSNGAVGQTLVWGDGKAESTFAVIILSQEIALGLVSDNRESEDFAFGVLIHELAHVHDNFICLTIYGPGPSLQQGNWASHRQFFAKSLWGEFFAETRTYPYIKDSELSEITSYSITLLNNAIEEINKEITAFQTHKEVGKVWAVAENKLSAVFNHFGRSLALLISDELGKGNKSLEEKFFAEINLVSKDWAQIINTLFDILNASEMLPSPDILEQICEVVDDGFRCVGLEPYI